MSTRIRAIKRFPRLPGMQWAPQRYSWRSQQSAPAWIQRGCLSCGASCDVSSTGNWINCSYIKFALHADCSICSGLWIFMLIDSCRSGKKAKVSSCNSHGKIYHILKQLSARERYEGRFIGSDRYTNACRSKPRKRIRLAEICFKT